MDHLMKLPAQPDGVRWPTDEWDEAPLPVAVDPADVAAMVDRMLGAEPDPVVGHTDAVAVVVGGRLVHESYGEREITPLAELAGVEPGPITRVEPLSSWSMAKSICHLAVGLVVADGLVDPGEPAPVAAWSGPGDARASITWDDLLTMRPGLSWTEVYDGFADDALPDVVTMLYGDGSADMAAFASDKPLVSPPGAEASYLYSSGTTNIVQRALQDVLGLDGAGFLAWLRARLFDPIGVTSFTGECDGAGLWVASSYASMTTRDWLRLGLLVLRGGTWDGRRLIEPAWIDHGRRPRSFDEGKYHGAHWWSWAGRDDGCFMAHGFEGQRLLMVADRDLIVFRHGRTPTPDGIDTLNRYLLDLVDLFPRR